MRFALVPPEHAALLKNSPDLRLPDILRLMVGTQRWKNGDLREWIDAFDAGRQRASERRNGGRPRDFGNQRGVKVQGRLPLTLERELEVYDGLKHFSATCLMAFDLYEEVVTYLSREPGYASPILSSGKSEIIRLCRLFERDDIEQMTLERMREVVRN